MTKKNKVQNQFLDELRKIPIVLVASEKSNISRNSIYRWQKDDKEFAEDMNQAMAEGEALVNDLSESQLLTLIKEKNWPALRFWLTRRNPKFKDKVEVTTKVDTESEELTPAQQEVVRKAFELASIIPKVTDKPDEE